MFGSDQKESGWGKKLSSVHRKRCASGADPKQHDIRGVVGMVVLGVHAVTECPGDYAFLECKAPVSDTPKGIYI